MNFKKWFSKIEWKDVKSGVIVGIIIIVITPISTFIIDYFKSVSMFSTLNILLNFKIKVWWCIFGFFILLTGFNFYKYTKKIPKPDYFNYNGDNFNNFIWIWNWGYNEYTSKWEIQNLHPICPKCNIQMHYIQKTYDIYIRCPKCNFKPSEKNIDLIDDVILIIKDKINKKNYFKVT